MTTFDFETYRNTCNKLFQLMRKGRGGIYVGGFEVLGADVFGHQLLVDSRHTPSLKVLYVPPSVETSVLGLMVNLIHNGMNCVDIGAGCGYYSLMMSTLIKPWGKVHSFEAIPECFSVLQRNLELNDVDSIVCTNRLVSNNEHEEEVTYFGGNYQFFFLNAEQQKERKAICNTISLDSYFETSNDSIDFVKVNDEERLPAVFEGMDMVIKLNPEIKILCNFNKSVLENKGVDSQTFLNNVRSKGFKIFALPTLEEIEDAKLLDQDHAKHILLARNLH